MIEPVPDNDPSRQPCGRGGRFRVNSGFHPHAEARPAQLFALLPISLAFYDIPSGISHSEVISSDAMWQVFCSPTFRARTAQVKSVIQAGKDGYGKTITH